MHFPTPDYGLQNTKYNMDYYRKSYFFPENLAIIIPKLEFARFEAVNDTRKLNLNYMEFWGTKHVIN